MADAAKTSSLSAVLTFGAAAGASALPAALPRLKKAVILAGPHELGHQEALPNNCHHAEPEQQA
ncbi:hypothetical protein HaLaN_26235, partial [Haematococcus lacustris]